MEQYMSEEEKTNSNFPTVASVKAIVGEPTHAPTHAPTVDVQVGCYNLLIDL
jgi:hypothetical protein